ncbi:cuticle protein 6-like [Euwallacea similis]|uniref:cuticle protein 6-like n=1 Tax=Euwallacea similis TaxID=1736056 RepID=UPI00344EEFEC
MKQFMIFFCIAVSALARPDGLLPDQHAHVSVTQSTDGTYRFFSHVTDSFRSEERFPDGSVVGEYSITDPNGIIQRFKYTAGAEGFKIIEGPVPVAPVDVSVPVQVPAVPNVPVSEYSGHSSAFEGVAPSAPAVVTHEVPVPVEYTAEVKAAREAHLALHQAIAHALGH